MAKVMVFIDGSWLYANTPRLADSYGKRGFQIDFGKLPAVVADAVREQLGNTEVDVVRTYLFGSYASNNHPADDTAVQRRLDFYDMLREEHHYEVEVFPINYRGRRLRKADRDPNDSFEAKEKCVDISLATSMLYFAAIPFAYDIAIAVVGDQDFKPVLQHVRRLGKRVAIASIKGSCAEDLADPTDQARIKDFSIIWIDDLLHKLELKHDPHQLDCESPTHKGPRKVWTEGIVDIANCSINGWQCPQYPLSPQRSRRGHKPDARAKESFPWLARQACVPALIYRSQSHFGEVWRTRQVATNAPNPYVRKLP